MGRLIMRRLGGSLLTVLLMTLVVHAGISLLPGDPVRALFGIRRPDPEVYLAMQELFHFDEPWHVRYVLFLKSLVTGQWGHGFPLSVRSTAALGPPITDLVRAAAPVSARIVGPVLLIQTLGGIATGLFVVSRRGRPSARLVYLVAVATIGIPIIALAFVLQTTFGYRLQWLPSGGLHQGWVSYILPVATLSLASTALVALLTRAELLETIRQPYITAARGRALPERRILGVHALRISVVPAVALAVASFGQLLTGLVFVEGIFGIGGIGGLMFGAIQRRDAVLLLVLLVIVTVVVSIATLVADVLHMVLDPRVQRDSEASRA